jgi:hypothetical protein
METITVNAKEWQELLLKINKINTFIEQFSTDNDIWLTGEEVCDRLKISIRTLQRLRAGGDLSYSTIAGKHFYKQSDIWQLMEKRKIKSRSERLNALKNKR